MVHCKNSAHKAALKMRDNARHEIRFAAIDEGCHLCQSLSRFRLRPQRNALAPPRNNVATVAWISIGPASNARRMVLGKADTRTSQAPMAREES